MDEKKLTTAGEAATTLPPPSASFSFLLKDDLMNALNARSAVTDPDSREAIALDAEIEVLEVMVGRLGDATAYPISVDALTWAKDFVAHVKEKPSIATDEETMHTWFANAIMAGYDSYPKLQAPRKARRK